MRATISAAMASMLLASACAGALAPNQGRVTGMVGGWPARPLGGEIAPAPGKTVQFIPTGGGPARSTTSGSDGRYTIDLDRGDYEVHLEGYVVFQMVYARNPATYGQWPRITVVPGQEVKLDLIFDTGIR